jgi:predicted DNA-binding protein (MmcQ/YjbR family)
MNIETVREFCMSLPHATEDVKWGNDLCFSVGAKLFCVCDLAGDLTVTIKVAEEEFHELCSTENIDPAKYTGRYGHVTISNIMRFSEEEWKTRIRKSYDLTLAKLPKKLRESL